MEASRSRSKVDLLGQSAEELAPGLVGERSLVVDGAQEEVDVAVDDDVAAPVNAGGPRRHPWGEVRVGDRGEEHTRDLAVHPPGGAEGLFEGLRPVLPSLARGEGPLIELAEVGDPALSEVERR